MSIPSFPETFRLYLQFAKAKADADFWENYAYSADMLDEVMDFIAENIEEPAVQALAGRLGRVEVGDDGA